MTIERLDGGISVIVPLMEQYKSAIGEAPLTSKQYEALESARQEGSIVFFVAKVQGEAVAMCSVSRTFSTFTCHYSGVFEDFYILPEYRGSGLAGRLTEHVFAECRKQGIKSLWVGAAPCDAEMYKHLGFEIPLGELLAWAAE